MTGPRDDGDRQVAPRALRGDALRALRAGIRGEVIVPGDPGWDLARQAWQVLVDQHPEAIVVAADERDVAVTVETAVRLGMRVAPQATGHAAGALGSLAGSILLRTTRLDAVEIDAQGRRARVGAGATAAAVAAAAAAEGLAVVGGMATTVGMVGFSLGGGLGWLARSHGLAASSILAIDAVDAAGRRVRADADHRTDLFWAARGAVAPVVVTSLELQLYPLPHLWAGAIMWPLERAGDVAHAWREWTAEVPESVTSLARILRYPPLPQVPEQLRGRAFVAVEVAIQGEAGDVAAVLASLRTLAPVVDTVRSMSPSELASVHGDPVDPVPAYGDALVLSELSTAAVDAVLDAALAPPSDALLSIELRQLGGMLTPGRVRAGAVSGIAGEALLYAVGIVPVPEAREPVAAAAQRVMDAARPYASGVLVKNFAERPAPASALYGQVLSRVREIVAEWDPDGVIVCGHPLD